MTHVAPKLLGLQLDIIIPLVLIVIAVVVVVASRMGVLPKKSLPYIIGGLATVFTLGLVKKLRRGAKEADLEQREDELGDLGKRADGTAASVDAADLARRQAVAEVRRQDEAVQKEKLLIQAQNAAERDRISNLHGEELFAEFAKTFGRP